MVRIKFKYPAASDMALGALLFTDREIFDFLKYI
jgi:hypothetical protein